MNSIIDRRQLLRGASIGAAGVGLIAWLPAWAQSVSPGIVAPLPTVAGDTIALRIARQTMMIDGHRSNAIGLNGVVPGPLIRLREGQTVRLSVTNDLDEDSSIHWHGLLVPMQYDGVPGISFPGIKPRSTFDYEFAIRQAGTYWYHSHSGLQEQLGHYGPIVIDPAGVDPIGYDREHVIVLSDHSQESPDVIFRHMKLMSGYYNRQKQTLSGLIAGDDQKAAERLKWGGMRMEPTDIADGTGAAYTYLVNGHGPRDNWTALFTPGERVRLRIINASSMTTFNVRIPGLPLTIVQADGLNVKPVSVDEFQIGVAETYDAIVVPTEDRALTLVGESVDRSGMARATLSPRAGMVAPVPALRDRPLATMTDMGMNMGGMAMGGMAGDRGIDPTAEQNASAALATVAAAPMGDMAMPAMKQGAMDMGAMAGIDHGGMAMGEMSMRDFDHAPGVKKSAGVATIAAMPADRTDYPGQGLEDVGHRVLTYRDLIALDVNPDVRAPSRTLDIHLTGNMERFMWSFDGVKMSDTMEPFAFTEGERVRVTLINDTMMAHPIHLHGHFFELVTGHGDHAPRKHTVIVQPGGKVTWDLTADAVGDWAFHCHLLYHMHAGMMRTVSVRPKGKAA
ncbi:copper resistance system multicopper oxidase [Sphingomonas oligophenolica]|uniref:Copper resistance system multicopper oxidase n=1 Tax=Sphingomonas oligophenolica TaxID=301154 RepID=A0A502CKW3_9SPHN|nr:copper resistance system multicopper oxidase [Sphingomonas oligophenolica]TPG12759.1 copper resistance system multicopper oxidase [Sphingomonas oligophenolica]